MRIVAYQGRPAGSIPPRHLAAIERLRPEFLVLPEYFLVPAAAQSHAEAAESAAHGLAWAASLSARLGAVVVAGSLVERGEDGKLYNASPVYDSGRFLGVQRKLDPTVRERERGIEPGAGLRVFESRGLRLGVLICADVLRAANFAALGQERVSFVAAPTLSPLREGEPVAAKAERDETIFVAGSLLARAPVVKACGVGRVFGGRLQGRSLIATPEGLAARVPYEREDRWRVLCADIEIAAA